MSWLRTTSWGLALTIAAGLPGGGCGGGPGPDDGGGAGGGPSGPLNVLVVHTSICAGEIMTKLRATGAFQLVNGFDAEFATPTVVGLLAYDVALVMIIERPLDRMALGDHLADYMDAGGAVVLTWASGLVEAPGGFDPEIAVTGRFASDDYYVIEPYGEASRDGPLGMTKRELGHPILAGVSTFSGGTDSWRPANATLHRGSTLIATWSDTVATPLVVARTGVGGSGVRRVDLGFYPASADCIGGYADPTTDVIPLLANALRWAGGNL